MGLLIAIVSLGLLCLVLEVLQLRKVFVPVTVAGLLLLFGITSYELYTDNTIFNISDLPEMLVFDQYGKAFAALFMLLTALILSMVPFCTRERPTQRADYSSIFLFLLSGAVAMVSFSNLSMFFIGLEVLSISLYLLSASNVKNKWSNEAGIKYFLMGSFASSIILFGIALVYGATGSFDMHKIAEVLQAGNAPLWYNIGVTMILIGMMFKVAAVPFHFWAPDVYQGAPTVVTTLMSSLVKVAAMATLYKLMDTMIPELREPQRIIILIISILTMTIGNLSAMRQINMKRLLAFSGISHAGFMLMSLLYLHKDPQILLYYAAAYALAGVAAFAVIIAVCHAKGAQDIGMFAGLGRKKPLMAVVLTFAMLSMAGIPIFSGFWAKLFLFSQMLSIGEYLLVIVGVINSIISVFFYFRVINMMFMQPSEDDKPIEYPAVIGYVATIAILLNILLGIFPSVITGLTL